MDILLGSILVKREEVENVGGKRKRGRREERIGSGRLCQENGISNQQHSLSEKNWDIRSRTAVEDVIHK